MTLAGGGQVGRRLLAVAVLLAAAACGDDGGSDDTTGTTAPTSAPLRVDGCAGDIVLVSTVTGEYEETGDIAGLTRDGEIRPITDTGDVFGPSISPDGSEVVVAAVGAGGEVSDSFGPYRLDIVVMDVDGSNRRTVVDAEDGRTPDWSPDGEHIAYVERGDPDSDADPDRIHVVAADGSDDHQLVVHEGPEIDADPAWSADGEQLAFVRRAEDGASQVMVAAADGTGAEVVHESPAWVGAPVWSPDGERLAFPAGETSQVGTLVVLTLATGAVVEGLPSVEGLSWAPSGRLYGFARPPAVGDFTGRWRVVELEPDGDGFARGRAIGAVDEVGFLYTDFSVDVAACLGPDAPPLTTEADEPETLVIAHPDTGEDVGVMTREQAVAIALDGRDGSSADGSMLVYGDETTHAALAAVTPNLAPAAGPHGEGDPPPGPGPETLTVPEGELVWLVAVDGGMTVLDASNGEQLSAGGGPALQLPDVPDLAP
jgi:dipeptidyl aminopeptidase/acylaminoacyl peptidase